MLHSVTWTLLCAFSLIILSGKVTVTVIRLIIRSGLPLRLTTPAGKQEGRIRATRCAEIRRGRTSPWVECAHSLFHSHTHRKRETFNHLINSLNNCYQMQSLSIYRTPSLNPLSDHEQTNRTNSSRKTLKDCESNKNHRVRRTKREPRNNKDLSLQPRAPQ